MESAAILLTIVSVLVVLSNGLVCGLILGCKNLRKPGNALIMSLAASDMITGGILIPVCLAVPTSPVNGYLLAASLVTGVASVCSISLDRYVAVLRPFRYKLFISRHFVKMITATWIIPTSVSLLPLIWQGDLSTTAHNVYLFFICVLFVIVPYLFVFIAYVRIFRKIRVHRKTLKAGKSDSHNNKRFPAEAKVAKIFFILVVLFLVSWSPILYSTMAFASQRPDIVPPVLATVSLFMLNLSSLVNPFLYCTGKKDIKSELKKLVPKRKAHRSDNYDLHESSLQISQVKARRGNNWQANYKPSTCRSSNAL